MLVLQISKWCSHVTLLLPSALFQDFIKDTDKKVRALWYSSDRTDFLLHRIEGSDRAKKYVYHVVHVHIPVLHF